MRDKLFVASFVFPKLKHVSKSEIFSEIQNKLFLQTISAEKDIFNDVFIIVWNKDIFRMYVRFLDHCLVKIN